MISRDYAKMLGKYEWQYKRAGKAEDPGSSWRITWPLVVTGPPGTGKTIAMSQYLDSVKIGLYFSFRNVSYSLALKIFTQRYPEVFNNCRTWDDFFIQLDEKLGFRYYASIVFEDVDFDRMDLRFIKNLRAFLKRHKSRNVFVILTSRKPPEENDGYIIIGLNRLTAGEITKTFAGFGELDRLRIQAMTDGVPGLLDMIDHDMTLRENMLRLYSEGSRFLRPAEEIIREAFRTPESYTSLLYGMATGIHKLTDLAEYSGYAPNKCDKYLRSLIDEGLVVTGNLNSEDGRTRRGYYLESSYMTLYIRYCMNRKYGQTGAELCDDIISCIDKEFLPGFFRRLCGIWIEEHSDKLHPLPLRFKDESNFNYTAGDVTFDYVQRDGEKMLFVKIWDDLDTTRGPKDWEKIQEAILPVNKFYNSEIVLCSLRRFRETMWDNPRAFRNLHLMEIRNMMTGDEWWDLREQNQDTFYKTWAKL